MRRSFARSQITIDASALVELLLLTPIGRSVEQAVAGAALIAPDVINPEVLQSLRNLERGGQISPERAAEAVTDLTDIDLRRVPTTNLIAGAWTLRANVSAYDACYVALARTLNCPLLTTDASLRRAPGLGVTLLRIA
ncbi:MAG TPA: type II toxin-antitoxin system VapC family toxin [Solirubrobacteraceae bacterium]|jgi:predicted nucleic acid-binding protein|nr:type II toxin-antitoxin system VapC family toxin [Solirubrobacteraceae bacterium]